MAVNFWQEKLAIRRILVNHTQLFCEICIVSFKQTLGIQKRVFWLHCTARCKKTVTTISKVHKPDNFESHSALKLRVTNIQGFHSNFVGCDVFLTSNLPEILGLCEANLNV